ncbi:DNA adenine methylase [Bradyrhizobium sp. SZCCHNRI1002]|uniref:DNA adenine methylase n=1 Tax=Bradyrhizobium sp. SZCCHNRI1002 TaxID=3057274 RepID=UPI0028E6B25E|nr:DNA adenine methylase [Bradyrhizobium sp. SZCCHNRI1002]
MANLSVSRPVMRYHGGKWRLAPWIIEHLPAAHRCYVEPFGGAGSVLLRKPRSFAETYNDLDGDIVNVFRVLRDPEAAERLKIACELTPFARSEFEAAYEKAADPVERARRILIRSWMGHGASGVRQHRTGFRVNPHRQRTTAAGDWRGWPEAIESFVDRLRGVTIESRPAIDVMKVHDRHDTLFYVDPPYMFDTRSQKRKRGDLYHGYNHELTDQDHIELIEFLLSVSGMVVLSGYASSLYDAKLLGWRRAEKEAQADRGAPRTEVIWINPACAEALDREGRGQQIEMMVG